MNTKHYTNMHVKLLLNMWPGGLNTPQSDKICNANMHEMTPNRTFSASPHPNIFIFCVSPPEHSPGFDVASFRQK